MTGLEDPHYDFIVTEKNRRSLDHLSMETGIRVEPLSDKEIQENFTGLAKSRNKLRVVKANKDIAIIKTYQKGDFELSAGQRAKNENAALRDLKKKGLSVPEVVANPLKSEQNEIVSLIKYEPGFYPLSSLSSTISEELSAESTHTDTIDSSYTSLSEVHKAGWTHNDAHLGNFLISENGTRMTVDFEQAEKLEYGMEHSWFLRKKDVTTLTADVIMKAALFNNISPSEVNMERIADSMQRSYGASTGETISDNDLNSIFNEAVNTASDMIREQKEG